MTNERTRDDTTRPEDWTGDEWAGDEAHEHGATGPDDPAQTATGTHRWNKTQWVGDQGEGAPAPIDPDAMPEGEESLSGFRHAPGEEHWADGQATGPKGEATEPEADRG